MSSSILNHQLPESTTIGSKTSQDYIMPSGVVLPFAMGIAPSGWLKCNGATISRTTYANLFEALVTNSGFTAQTFTVTIATPAVFSKTGHGFTGGERLRFSTTGTLPTGINTTSDFFVIYLTADTFGVTAVEGSTTRVNTSVSQSGTHTYLQSWWGLGDGTTTFNVPDMRGEFVRGWVDDRTVDGETGRKLASYEEDQVQGHRHTVYQQNNTIAGGKSTQGTIVTNAPSTNNQPVSGPITDGTNGTPRTGKQTRPRNKALLYCIKE